MKTGELGCLFGVYTEDHIDLIKAQANTLSKSRITDKPKCKVKFKKSGKTYPKKTR